MRKLALNCCQFFFEKIGSSTRLVSQHEDSQQTRCAASSVGVGNDAGLLQRIKDVELRTILLTVTVKLVCPSVTLCLRNFGILKFALVNRPRAKRLGFARSVSRLTGLRGLLIDLT